MLISVAFVICHGGSSYIKSNLKIHEQFSWKMEKYVVLSNGIYFRNPK